MVWRRCDMCGWGSCFWRSPLPWWYAVVCWIVLESLGEVVRFVKIKSQGLCRRCEMHWTLPQEVFQLGKTWQSTCSGLAKIMDKGEICDMSGLVRHPLASFDLLSILEHLETNCRPLRLEVTEPFDVRVRLFAFPGAGDSVAAWVQFVNKAWTCYVPMFPFLLFLTLFRSWYRQVPYV